MAGIGVTRKMPVGGSNDPAESARAALVRDFHARDDQRKAQTARTYQTESRFTKIRNAYRSFAAKGRR
jgi:hypothetical protein